jgi:hypothetical protein
VTFVGLPAALSDAIEGGAPVCTSYLSAHDAPGISENSKRSEARAFPVAPPALADGSNGEGSLERKAV